MSSQPLFAILRTLECASAKLGGFHVSNYQGGANIEFPSQRRLPIVFFFNLKETETAL